MRRKILTLALVGLLMRVAVAHAQTIEYYGLDAIGSVRVVFDGSGNVIGRMDYGPFGQELIASTGKQKNIFAGVFAEGEAGFDYAEARMYQPRTGRFNRPDPINAGLMNPQRWNAYSYALNNPLSFSDSTGLQANSQLPGSFCAAEYSYASCGGDGLFWDNELGGGGFQFGGEYARAQEQGYVPGMPPDIWAALEQFGQELTQTMDAVREAAQAKQTELRTRVRMIGACEDDSGDVCDRSGNKIEMHQSIAVRTGPGAAVAVGRAGEEIVRALTNIGAKTRMVVNGRVRIADGKLGRSISEVKNVAYQAYTRQLRDFADAARENQGVFNLFVRYNTKLSLPLQDAIIRGEVYLSRVIRW